MKIKTKGKCIKCGEAYSPEKGSSHLLECALQSSQPAQVLTEGYLIRIACATRPKMYWMFVAIPKNASLELLDKFLRDTWLECCGHLSQFTIGSRRIMSHTEPGNPNQSMKNSIGQILSPGMKCEYIYDMGSSTNLELEVIAEITTCPQKKVTMLMLNDPIDRPCESCKKTADTICSSCDATICTSCTKRHPCVFDENDDYILMPLVNSPRAGVCGYVGKVACRFLR